MTDLTPKREAELRYLASLPEAQQDAYILNQIPASQRQQFITDLQHAAAEDEDIFGRLAERVTTAFNADDRAQRLAEQAIAQSTTGSTKYVPGVTGSPGNPIALDHKLLKQWSQENNEPSSAGDISADYDGMKTGYEGMNESVTAAVGKLRGAWEGTSAEAASGFGDQLAQYTKSNSSNARLAAEVTALQSEASSRYRDSMPEPIPFSWQDELNRAEEAGPFGGPAVLEEAFEKQARSQAAHEQAAQVTTDFESATYTSASKTPVFAEPPKFDAGGGSDPGDGDDKGGKVPVPGRSPRVGSPNGGSTTPSSSGPPGGGSNVPSVQPPGTPSPGGPSGGSGLPPGAVRLPDGSIRLPDGTIIKPDGTRILPDGRVIPPTNTRSSGFGPGGSSSDFGPGGSSGPGGPGVLGGVGGPGSSAGAGGGSAGAAGGFGPGAGSGAGTGGLGAGKGAGGFGPGAGVAAKAGAGGMGRGGMGGMAGGAGGRGQSDDDKEHQDQYYVKQELDPGLRIEEDEYGEKLIDESTGMTVVPPVIGE